jgi:DNA-binding CsgD family transcriptional regulator/tetratricopeptide (TPR) repeat protein
MKIVERENEMGYLAGLLAAADAGRGCSALVTGPVAVGKSTLLDAFTEHALAAGVLALTAVAAEAEKEFPLGVMRQLMHRIPLGPDERQLVRALLAQGTTTVVHDLCAVFLEHAESRPVVIVVDDVHHADDASLLCLSYLIRRLRGSRIMAAFGCASHSVHMRSEFEAGLRGSPHCHQVPLRPLTPDGIAELACDRLGEQMTGRVGADCYAISGGNPLLIAGLLDDQKPMTVPADDGEPAAEPELAVGDGFVHAVLAVVRRAPAELVRVIEGLAVLGAPDHLHRLVGSDPESADRVLRALDASGLITAGQFRHPAARSAVLAGLDAGRRSVLHQAAAKLLYGEGRSAVEVAEHLVAAGHGDEPWTVAVLENAASLALSRDRLIFAIECLKLACVTCTDGPRLARLQAALMRAERQVNFSASPTRLAALLDAVKRGDLPDSDALALVRTLLWQGRVDEVRDVLSRIRLPVAADGPEIADELRFTRSWLRCYYPPLTADMPPDDGAGQRTEFASSGWRLAAVSALDAVLGDSTPPDQAGPMAERVLRGARIDLTDMDAVESALLALTYGEFTGQAAALCDELIEEVGSRQPYPASQARLAAVRAEISLRQGDLATAERQAKEALRLIPVDCWGVSIGTLLASLLTALTAMGRPEEAADYLRLPVPDAMLQSRPGLHYLRARGRHRMSIGDLDAALQDFRRCGALMREWNLDVPGLIPWRCDAAEVLLQLGDRGEAQRLTDEQLARCGSTPSRAGGVALRLRAAAGDPRQRPALLRRSADVLQDRGDWYELARTLTDLTRTFRDLRGLRLARLTGRRAWMYAEFCRAKPLMQVLGAELGHKGSSGEPGEAALDGPDGKTLSSAELRVAHLAAHGYTNREIATRLYVTVSTVEQHLTRVYRKLQITSRADLPSTMEVSPTAG